MVLDGTNDDLVVASSTDFDFGTGDFTLDCWCRRTTTDSGGDTIFSRYLSSNNQLFLDVNLGKFRFFFQNAGVGVIITGTTTLAIDTWYHVAVVRTGSTWKLFVNGTQEGGDQTSTESVNNLTGQDFYIGGWSGGSLYKFEGYLDEVRISDSARWTAGFTVPSAEYSSDANTKLLLHLNGGATTFVDDSFSPHTVTANGDAQIDSSQYKFGGASGKFDGTGDYLTVLDSDDWYHSGDFTWDCWVRFNGTPTSAVFIAQYQDASNLLRFDYNTTNGLEFSIYSGGVWVLDMYRAWTPSADTWHHVAVVRSGSTWYLFADGLQLGTTATYAGYPNLAGSLYIGQVGDGTNYFNGWIDEVRISNGIARWTADFTVPTEEYSALAVLLNKRERHRIARPIDRIPSDVLVW
ncbi:MAG: hypothetical protein DRN14_00255 [Thermoplasmata archaeon]|nr:MAG: hypothetical protein DRN14_00255 [Thermoplasmata archaeon]